jgi:hypothetical protein
VPGQDVDRRYTVVEQVGWMGKIFGIAATPSVTITGVIALPFAVSVVLVLFIPSKMEAAEHIKIVVPVISLMVGYLFGKST